MIKNQRGKKAKFLKELEDTPLIARVCQKLSISRATFYRWRGEDQAFRDAVDIAIAKGRDRMNDFAESKLIENMNLNVHQAIVFWLRHNHPRYRPPGLRVYIEENDQQRDELKQLHRMFDWLIQQIGFDELLKIAGHDPEVFKAEVRKKADEQRKKGSLEL